LVVANEYGEVLIPVAIVRKPPKYKNIGMITDGVLGLPKEY
jgi:hypothetical protein